MELIDKEKVIKKVKTLRKRAYELYGCSQFVTAYNNVLDSIDTHEVKEVDLEKEMDFVKDAYYYFTSDERDSMMKVARHFFELGLKVQKGE